MRLASVRSAMARTAAACVLAFAAAAPLWAQGVTSAAVRGRVMDESGLPVVGASIVATNTANGQRFRTATTEGGRFFLANVLVGNYTVEARAIGYRPVRQGLTVSLGQVADVGLTMAAATVELTAIEVTAAPDNSLASPNRTGTTATVDRTLVANLPSINRNFADFAATNPLVNSTGGGTGVSVAGTSDRFNNLQIDGGTSGDLFGLASSNGSPGGANNSRPLSIEAVQEYQVLIAPFDVRQGGFTGGLINGVTRSGTNQFHGSAFYYVQNQDLVGQDTLGRLNASDFSLGYRGFSLGGPIIRDRLHFFVSTEWRHQTAPFSGLSIGSDTTGGRDSVGIGIRSATAARVRAIAQDSFGFDPGTAAGPTIPTPDANIFAKLSGQLGSRSQVELSYTRTRSSRLQISHTQGSASATNIRDGYQLGSSGYHVNSATNTVRGRLNIPFGNRFTNEAIVSYNFFQDNRLPDTRAPMILVGGDRAGVYLGIGGERFSHDNLLEQNILEIADNVTAGFGRHVFTVGGRMSRFTFLNRFWNQRLGGWLFRDTTAFANAAPTRYEINLPGSAASAVGRADGPIADFTFTEYSLYAQDQYQATGRLSLSLGVRVDFEALPSPTYNPLVDTATVGIGASAHPFGVRTDNAITSAELISPRFGFNYDVRGDASTVLRGGLGLFAGRTPYVWASNAYTNTGLEQVQLVCSGTNVPTFTADPDNQPTACATAGTLTLPKPSVVYFDKSFKLPQTMRASLGLDRRLPWDMTGSFDALYTKSINQFILTDENIAPNGRTAFGEAGRVLYGIPSGSSFTLNRRTSVANQVLRQYNSNKDYSYSLTFQLAKRFRNGDEISTGYTYGRSYDLMSYSSDISSSLLNFATLDGTLANRNLTPSWFDIPHSIRVSGTIGLPYDVRFSLFYTGHSGRPYGWTYSSDVNGDGAAGNDMVYVPIDSADMTLATPSQWSTLNAFIRGQSCLNEARGTVMRRDACRNPWVNFLDARVAKRFGTLRGQAIELTANIFNLPALLGVGGWIFSVTGFENITMLRRTGYDATHDRGVYSLGLPAPVKFLNAGASRWKLELGARYTW